MFTTTNRTITDEGFKFDVVNIDNSIYLDFADEIEAKKFIEYLGVDIPRWMDDVCELALVDFKDAAQSSKFKEAWKLQIVDMLV